MRFQWTLRHAGAGAWFSGALVLMMASACGELPTVKLRVSDVESYEQQIVIGSRGAWFKSAERNADVLVENLEKCLIPANTRLMISGDPRPAENGHVRIQLAQRLPDCEFTSGFILSAQLASGTVQQPPMQPPPVQPPPVWQPPIQPPPIQPPPMPRVPRVPPMPRFPRVPPMPPVPPIQPPPVQPPPNPGPVPPQGQEPGQPEGTIPRRTPKGAFLSTIAFAEGTNEKYNVTFGYKVFSDYSKHPRMRVCSGSLCSDAAGRYQILSSTWDSVVQRALKLPDFTPASQDRAGVHLVENRGVRDMDTRYNYNQFEKAIYKLNREWASLPGSPYGQPTRKMAELWKKYESFVP